jgi:GYF domain 2
MVDAWFYARDAHRLGPFSSAELLELATTGEIRPTDTVWKKGIAQGVLAAKVKYLFPATQTQDVARAEASVANAGVSAPVPAEASPPLAPPKTPAPKSNLQPVKKGRAIALTGAIVFSQDGLAVQYRKKCIKCGHVDVSKNKMLIRPGVTRASYYCPKCRKLREVTIQGVF